MSKSALLLAALAVAVGACGSPGDAPPGRSRPAAPGAPSSADAQPPGDRAPAPRSAGAETDKTVELSFAPGASRAEVADTLVRFALHDYLVRASAGQILTATLTSDGPPTVLVIDNDEYQPGDFGTVPATVNQAGSSADASDGWVWRGTLPRDGVYRVRVAHSGPAANGGSVSPYALSVEIE